MIQEFPDIQLIDSPPTRGNVRLDQTASNIADFIVDSTAEPPLESDQGTRSNHMSILIKARIPRVHHFTKTKLKYQPITEAGKEDFIRAVSLTDWSDVFVECPSKAAEILF